MQIRKPGDGKISLTNEGHLSVVFIGVGSAFAAKNFQTNLLVVKGSDHLQIDSGTKCSTALRQAGISVPEIKNIHLTHSHADHIGGMEEVGLIGRYISPNKPKVYITEEYQQILWNYSLKGGSAFSEKNGGKYLSFEDFFDPVRPIKLAGYPRDTYEFDVGTLNVKIMRTMHIPEDSASWKDSVWSTGVILDDRVMFTSDTKFDRDLILDFDARFHFETIFHDVQFFKGGIHSFLGDIATLPAEVKSRIRLVHYGDNFEKFEDRIREDGFADFVRPQVYYDF